MRVVKGRPLNVRHTFLEDDEETPLALSGVNATLFDPLGDEVATVAASDGGSGVWSATFPAQPMGRYRVEFSDGTYTESEHLEVTGGSLFSVSQARKSDDYLTDTAAFPAAEIVHYREVVEAEFQEITHRSFVERVEYVNLAADGTRELVALIPDASEVEAVWLDGEQVADVSDWRVSSLGKITAPAPLDDGANVVARVRYGYTTPPPKVAQAGMVRLRNLIAAESSGIPDRATTWQPEEGGTFRLATPGQGRWQTGIPEVDSTLRRYTLDTVLAVYAGG